MAEEKVGKITHFYDKISVAIVDVSGSIKVGDTIKIKKDGEEFEQSIDSMQIEHDAVQEAKAGDKIGLKVSQPAKQGAEVFKVSE